MTQLSSPASELTLHIKVVFRLRQHLTPGWLFFHVPAGEARDRRHAAKLKALGAKAGIADLLLINPNGRLFALELKRVGAGLSPQQQGFRDFCNGAGVSFAVARSLDEAVAAFKAWGCLREEASA